MQGPGKKWEHLELNKNGKPQRVSMHVLKGDTVKVRGNHANRRSHQFHARPNRGVITMLVHMPPMALPCR